MVSRCSREERPAVVTKIGEREARGKGEVIVSVTSRRKGVRACMRERQRHLDSPDPRAPTLLLLTPR